MRAFIAVLAALSLLTAVSSCARHMVVHGHASPDTTTKPPISDAISELVPGSPFLIGEGASARVCTAAWVVSMTGQLDGRLGILTAGSCAPNKAPVSVQYVPSGKSAVVGRAKDVVVGHVVAGGPLTDVPEKPDISVIWVTEQPSTFGSLRVRPNAHVPIATKMIDNPTLWIDQYGAPVICWAYAATHPELNVAKTACGTARTSTRNTFTIRPDDPAKLLPVVLGAPAWIRSGAANMGNVIAGVVTSIDNGMIVVTGINAVVKRIPAVICLDAPADGTGCTGPDLTEHSN